MRGGPGEHVGCELRHLIFLVRVCYTVLPNSMLPTANRTRWVTHLQDEKLHASSSRFAHFLGCSTFSLTKGKVIHEYARENERTMRSSFGDFWKLYVEGSNLSRDFFPVPSPLVYTIFCEDSFQDL